MSLSGSMFSQSFSISDKVIGKEQPVFIVAEAGVSHFGNLDKAMKLVDMASDAGADAVKFQIFKAKDLVSAESQGWRKRMGSRELPYEAFSKISDYSKKRGIIFFATAHDEPSLEFLETLKVPLYKVGSGEVGNWRFLKKAASKGKPIIVSTGMYTLKEVGKALEVIAEAGNANVVILHCVTSYPTPPKEANLCAIDTIRDAYSVLTGYSDHTEGFHLALAAVARGACVIEKHITLDFNIPDAQDWKVSCGPEDLSIMIKHVRDVEAGLGSGSKVPTEAERSNMGWARKSLVAAVDILPGETITADKISAKRPGSGIVPADMEKVVGRKAKVKIEADTLINWEKLS